MNTYVTKIKDIKREWHLVDVANQVLGRQLTKISSLLMGKHKVYFTPALDCGDYVVVINSDKVKVTGKKETDLLYQWHTNYPGGFRQASFKEQMAKDSRKIIERSIKNMLPKNKLRDPRLARLKVFKTAQHDYQDKFKNSPK